MSTQQTKGDLRIAFFIANSTADKLISYGPSLSARISRTARNRIAGWTIHLFGDRPNSYYMADEIKVNHAAELLGLDLSLTGRLFTPIYEHDQYDCTAMDGTAFITPQHAAACLRHLGKNGEVD